MRKVMRTPSHGHGRGRSEQMHDAAQFGRGWCLEHSTSMEENGSDIDGCVQNDNWELEEGRGSSLVPLPISLFYHSVESAKKTE